MGGGRRSRRRSTPVVSGYAVAALLVLVGTALAAAALRPEGSASLGTAQTAVMSTAGTALATRAPVLQPAREPTPLFAHYRSLYLRLPVDPASITQVAFHQASGDKAFHMTSLVPDADLGEAARLKHAPMSLAATQSGVASDSVTTIWNGQAIRLWRSNRRGTPDTAVDVGANAASDVYAPVTGTVLEVRAYKLYDKYPDYEIHIAPDGWEDIDVVLIHVDDVSVTPGDRVQAGVTRIACVRKMSDKVDLQLKGYTRNGGDHVHVQLNKVSVPGKLDTVTGS